MFARAFRSKLFVLLLIMFALFPSMAFADDGFEGSGGGDFSDKVIYGPNVLDIQSGTYGVQVYAGNKFNAALCVLGFDGSDSRFTNDVKAYLSNESTGGSFYEFSNQFTNNNSTSFTGFGVGNITFDSSIELNNLLYGAEFVWIAQYTDTLRQAAYARVEDVLDGNIGSGGGNSGATIEGDYIVFRGNTWIAGFSASSYVYIPDKSGHLYTNNTWRVQEQYGGILSNDNATYANNRLLPESLTIKARKGMFTRFLTTFTDTSKYVCYFSPSGDNLDFGILADTYDVLTQTNAITGLDCITQAKGKYCNTGQLARTDTNLYIDGNTIYCLYPTRNDMNWGSYNAPSSPISLLYAGGQGDVVPPTQWPEPDPVTPTEPPAVPDPPSSDPVSDPTDVNIGIPQLPNIGLTTEPTYETADLSAVLDAMAEHCQHLQSCMIECFDSYYSSITQFEKSLQENSKEFFRSWFRVTLDTIRDCFNDLSDYLQRLFTWLADQMDFTFTGGDFDDTSIVWWLKRIYSKLGSGTTVRPTDPVVDPTGIGDWFDQLIKNFVLDLLALGQDGLADIVEMFRQLITKFPFSIPWDIAAILGLFVATPEIPVIEIPQFALVGNGITQVGTYRISLEPYDGAMGIARGVQNVLFACWLAFKMDFFKTLVTGVLGGDK